MKCGYQLRGLPLAGVCSECGTPVQDSLKGYFLQYASAEYRNRVAKGLALVLNAILVMIVLMVVQVGVTAAVGTSRGLQVVFEMLDLALTVMAMVGYWWYTEPDPGFTGVEKPKSARQVIRVAVLVQAALQVVQLVLTSSGVLDVASASNATLSLITILAGMVGLAQLAAWVTQFFAVMLYTRWIGRRIPDAFIERRSRVYMWLLPVLSTVGALAMGLGVLIAMVLYWNLLHRLRKHVESINKRGVPESMPGMGG